MLYKLRRRVQDEKGFTLIELLVVILIIGILAAIAIPAFLNQTSKANDSAAKTQLHTGATEMQTCFTDHPAGGAACNTAALVGYEPSLGATGQATFAVIGATDPTPSNYTLQSVVAATGDTFTYTETNGAISRNCSSSQPSPASGGCVGGTW